MKKNKMIFIVNEMARNGKSGEIWGKLETLFDEGEYEVIKTNRKGHANEIAKDIVKTTNERIIIVAVGGDGTIHEVVNGVATAPHITVAYIRAGSGNDFARGYKLPKHPTQCFTLLMDLHEQEINQYDLGVYTTNQEKGYFVNSIGAGFDALVASKANQSKLKYWFNKCSLGSLVYAYVLLAELFTYKPKNLYITIDGTEYIFPNTWFITVCNQAYYGGGMRIAPDADPRNGKLKVVIAYNLPKLKFLSLFVSVFWGGHVNLKNVAMLEGEKLTFSYDGEVLAHADGESITPPPFEIEIIPKGWKLITKK